MEEEEVMEAGEEEERRKERGRGKRKAREEHNGTRDAMRNGEGKLMEGKRSTEYKNDKTECRSA